MAKEKDIQNVKNEPDYEYFFAYGIVSNQKGMLKDTVRMNAFEDCILLNKHLFKGKVVLDVGSGLGILSLLSAKAGAACVIGVEYSSAAKTAKRIVADNRYEDIITIVEDKMENVTELPNGITQVDIIVSEWLGVCLFHESMLSTVLYARDRWLKPNGLMFPNEAQLYIGMARNPQYRPYRESMIDVNGVDITAMGDAKCQRAKVQMVEARNVLTTCAVLKRIDLLTCDSDFAFEAPFELCCLEEAIAHLFFTYFDFAFTQIHVPVTVSTSPYALLTHWHQTTFYFDELVYAKPKRMVRGTFSLRQSERNFRDLSIRIQLADDPGFDRSYIL